MRGRMRELRLAERARRAELADVRHRLDVLTDRRLLATWTEDEAIEYTVLSMREHELLAQRTRPGVRRVVGGRADSTGWMPTRREVG